MTHLRRRDDPLEFQVRVDDGVAQQLWGMRKQRNTLLAAGVLPNRLRYVLYNTGTGPRLGTVYCSLKHAIKSIEAVRTAEILHDGQLGINAEVIDADDEAAIQHLIGDSMDAREWAEYRAERAEMCGIEAEVALRLAVTGTPDDAIYRRRSSARPKRCNGLRQP